MSKEHKDNCHLNSSNHKRGYCDVSSGKICPCTCTPNNNWIEEFKEEDFEIGTTMDGDNTEINKPKLIAFITQEKEKSYTEGIEVGKATRHLQEFQAGFTEGIQRAIKELANGHTDNSLNPQHVHCGCTKEFCSRLKELIK